MHVPPTSYHLLAAQQKPSKKAYVLLKNDIGDVSRRTRKVGRMDH